MRRLLGILASLVLVLAGLGVVRPQVVGRSRSAWEPVARSEPVVPYHEGETVEIAKTGEYVVFLEGPAQDEAWSRPGSHGVQILERRTMRPLATSEQGIDYAYASGDRRGEAIERVAIANPGTFELGLGRAASAHLDQRGFAVRFCPLRVVDRQAWKSRLWLVGGITAGALMAVLALSLLSPARL
jgi:hypothetical protein